MNPRPISLSGQPLVKGLAFGLSLAISMNGSAGIDSGGGKTAVGALQNHGSLGEPIATISAENGISVGARPGLIEVLYAANIAHDDFDSDGMPDAWENNNDLTNPNGDADGDGQKNRQEYIAGTNPNSGTSVFRVENARKVGSNWEFDLPTMNGRQYRVYSSPSMQPGSWHRHSTITGTGETLQISVPTGNAPALFFRVEVNYP